MSPVPTPSQTVGPYFWIGLTQKYSKPKLAAPETKGERVRLTFTVLDGDGIPVDDCMLEIWQADADGKYRHPDDPRPQGDLTFAGFGRVGTDECGLCSVETIRPGRVPGPGNVLQAPHLNLAVYARGILKQFYTRVYFAGDPANADDPILAAVPKERRETLLAQPDPAQAGHWRMQIRLQGEQETVFFDI